MRGEIAARESNRVGQGGGGGRGTVGGSKGRGPVKIAESSLDERAVDHSSSGRGLTVKRL